MRKRLEAALVPLLITIVLALVLPGCGPNPGAGMGVSGGVSAAGDRSGGASEEEPEEVIYQSEPITMEGLAIYRGILVKIDTETEEGIPIYRLERAPGTRYAPAINITFGVDTQVSFHPRDLEIGDFLEVFYADCACAPLEEGVTPEFRTDLGYLGEDLSQWQTAAAANRLPDVALVNYNGTLVSVSETDRGRDLLLQDLDTPQDASEEELQAHRTIFHITEETQLYLGEEVLVPGAKLNIYHRGALTRSIPPQGSALEVTLMLSE